MKNIIESDFYYKGYRCVVIFTAMGHRCGYLGVKKDHPLFGKSYSDDTFPDLPVHGGVTYTRDGEHPLEIENEYWWIGFDTAHLGDAPDLEAMKKYDLPTKSSFFASDGELVRSLEYCRNELINLVDYMEVETWEY